MFLATVLWNGQVIGTWKKQQKDRKAKIRIAPFRELGHAEIGSIKDAVAIYGDFLEKEIQVEFVA